MNAITVGLVLEHRMVVDILASWLNRQAPADIHLVATATTSTSVQGNLADATVIIADRHSLTALTSTKSGTNAATIVLLTNHPGEGETDDERVRAYVAPTDEVDVLTDAIRSAAEPTASALYRSPRIADFIDTEHGQAIEIENAVALTVKQRRVLDLYVDGLTAQEIAETLGMARNTVRTYIKNIRAKYRSAGSPVRSKIELLHAAHSPTTITKPATRKAKTGAAADTEKSKPRDTPEAEPALPRNLNGSEEEPSCPTLTVADLSRIFSLDEKTVRKHLKVGTIPAYRVRHHWLIFTAEVRALFDDPDNLQPAPDILADYGDTMKPRDLQTLFGSSRQTINLWLKQGILPGYWIGTRWLIHTHQIRQTLTTYSNRNTHVREPGETLLPPAFARLS